LTTKIKNILKMYDGTRKKGTIFIKKGEIVSKPTSDQKVTSVNGEGMVVFSGLIDLGTIISDPGNEYRETLEQTCEAAYEGGFAALIAMPGEGTNADSKTYIEYLARRSGGVKGVKLYPLAPISERGAGDHLVEFIDLHHSGVIGFSDGMKPLQKSGVLMRAMEYVKAIDGIIITSPLDPDLFPQGQVNEGTISIQMGLPGIPEAAEEISVHRDISLAKLTNSRLHLYCISTRGSIDLVRKAKKAGLQVTCSVSANNLLFTDTEVGGYNSELKLLPPLRDSRTQKALWSAVVDGTIDIIVSQHTPLEPERKDLEFYYADFGTLGLQTVVGALLQKYGVETAAPVIQRAMHDRIKEVFNIESDTGQVIFGPMPIEFKREKVCSNCYNSPYLDHQINYSRINY